MTASHTDIYVPRTDFKSELASISGQQIGAVRVNDKVQASLWKHLMQADSEALPYQSPEWLTAACKSSGFANISRTYQTSDGAKYVLPLVRPAGLPKAISKASSMPPAWGMGGLIGEAPVTVELARAVFKDLRGLGFLAVGLRPNPRQASIWAEACPADFFATARRAHVLDLRIGFDEIWANHFSAKMRNKVGRAERAGVEVEFDDTGRFVSVFYELFEQSLERWAHKQHEPIWMARWRGRRRDPIEKLQQISDSLARMCCFGVARIRGKPAAAILVLRGRNVNFSRAAMDHELVGSSGANEYLQRHSIQQAINSGCNFYHLGESGQSASLSHFKEKLGAVAVNYAEYHQERWPISRLDTAARTAVKRLIGFKEVS